MRHPESRKRSAVAELSVGALKASDLLRMGAVQKNEVTLVMAPFKWRGVTELRVQRFRSDVPVGRPAISVESGPGCTANAAGGLAAGCRDSGVSTAVNAWAIQCMRRSRRDFPTIRAWRQPWAFDLGERGHAGGSPDST